MRFYGNFFLFRHATLGLCLCLSLTYIAGCHSHLRESEVALSPQLNRSIELVVRAQMNVPANWTVVPEQPKPGVIPGYDDIDIDFETGAGNAHKQIVRFLLSKDRKRLAKLSDFELSDSQRRNLNTSYHPFLGSKDAPIEIVDFDDLECPYCAKMSIEILPSILASYKGLVKVVYKDLPLVDIHPWAMHAAVDANCLAPQSSDAYWSFIKTVHSTYTKINGNKPSSRGSLLMLDALAQEEGSGNQVNREILDDCLARQDPTEVLQSIQDAKNLRIHQTPTLFISGEKFIGTPSDSMLRASIDRALRSKGLEPPPVH